MKVLNSDNSPLQIATISVPSTSGYIGMTVCPGKQGASNSDHYWERSLQDDLDAIDTWNAEAIVTILEDFEFDLLKIRDLEAELMKRGVRWFHFEIEDGSVPDSRFIDKWPRVLGELRTLLRNGQKVLIHCRGGLGRTGTVAALILKEFGQSSEDAISNIRAARPGAIETNPQEDFIRNYVAISSE